jgi:hypothetical protein
MVKVDNGDTNHQLLTTEIEALNSFRSDSGLALSVYIDLRSTQQKEKAIDMVRSLVRRCLQDMRCSEKDWEAIQEDLDLIQIYLRTNGNRQAVGVAVFSCAQDLFWRAWPVWMPIKTEVYVGPEFNTRQLQEVMERVKAKSVA